MKSKNIYNIIRFDYVNDFQCNGTYCGSRCCQKWGIEIDKVTLHKYRNLKDEKMRCKIDSEIKYIADMEKYLFQLKADGKCPFLRDDYLCSLQKSMGESYLSDICATYPRRFVEFANYVMESLSVSCPVVARNILLSNRAFQLKEIEGVIDRKKIIIKKLPREQILIDKWLDIQCGGMKILQDRRLTIRERLQNLCMFGEALETLHQKDSQMQGLDDLLKSFLDDRELLKMAKLANELPSYPNKFIKDLIIIMDKFFIKKRNTALTADFKYMDMLQRCLNLNDNNEVGKIYNIYGIIWLKYKEKVLDKYKFFQENYIVHQWFNTMMPIMARGTIKENIVTFLLYFRLQELLLMLEAASADCDLTEKNIVECISYGGKILEHEDVYFDVCSEYVTNNNYSLIDIMQIWLPI